MNVFIFFYLVPMFLLLCFTITAAIGAFQLEKTDPDRGTILVLSLAGSMLSVVPVLNLLLGVVYVVEISLGIWQYFTERQT